MIRKGETLITTLKSLKNKTWFMLKETLNQFMSDNAIRLSASLSYYTIFSLPALLIITIYLAGIFFGTEAVRGEIFGQINGFVGNDMALQIQEMIKNINLSENNGFAAIGIITLLLGAIWVFEELQDSINFIWGLKAKPKRRLITFIKHRLISFSIFGSMGFLLLVGLIINSIIDLLIRRRTKFFFPGITVFLFYTLNTAVLFIIITLLFVIIFHTLPDGKVSYKDTIIGAAFTALLFIVGKSAIGTYIGSSSIASIYGATGSLIVILLWVYYSAIILYFGVEFTKVYALKFGNKIIPNDYAVCIDKQEREIEPRIVNTQK